MPIVSTKKIFFIKGSSCGYIAQRLHCNSKVYHHNFVYPVGVQQFLLVEVSHNVLYISTMYIERDLNIIKENARKREKQNWRFRSYLKGYDDPDEIDRIVHELNELVSAQIDCTECANCCIVLRTDMTLEEIDSAAEYLNFDKEEFIKNETSPVESDDEGKLSLKEIPCKFLEDKKCTIYPVRPEECRGYPYLHKDGFIFRLFGVIDNYEMCPIVYNVYEMLKRRLRFR